MKIWVKLFLGFAVVIAIISIVGFISIQRSQKELEKTIGEGASVAASILLEEIDILNHSKIQIIQEVVQRPVIQRIISESNKEFELLGNIQAYIAEKDREWTSVPHKEITPLYAGNSRE